MDLVSFTLALQSVLMFFTMNRKRVLQIKAIECNAVDSPLCTSAGYGKDGDVTRGHHCTDEVYYSGNRSLPSSADTGDYNVDFARRRKTP